MPSNTTNLEIRGKSGYRNAKYWSDRLGYEVRIMGEYMFIARPQDSPNGIAQAGSIVIVRMTSISNLETFSPDNPGDADIQILNGKIPYGRFGTGMIIAHQMDANNAMRCFLIVSQPGALGYDCETTAIFALDFDKIRTMGKQVISKPLDPSMGFELPSKVAGIFPYTPGIRLSSIPTPEGNPLIVITDPNANTYPKITTDCDDQEDPDMVAGAAWIVPLKPNVSDNEIMRLKGRQADGNSFWDITVTPEHHLGLVTPGASTVDTIDILSLRGSDCALSLKLGSKGSKAYVHSVVLDNYVFSISSGGISGESLVCALSSNSYSGPASVTAYIFPCNTSALQFTPDGINSFLVSNLTGKTDLPRACMVGRGPGLSPSLMSIASPYTPNPYNGSQLGVVFQFPTENLRLYAVNGTVTADVVTRRGGLVYTGASNVPPTGTPQFDLSPLSLIVMQNGTSTLVANSLTAQLFIFGNPFSPACEPPQLLQSPADIPIPAANSKFSAPLPSDPFKDGYCPTVTVYSVNGLPGTVQFNSSSLTFSGEFPPGKTEVNLFATNPAGTAMTPVRFIAPPANSSSSSTSLALGLGLGLGFTALLIIGGGLWLTKTQSGRRTKDYISAKLGACWNRRNRAARDSARDDSAVSLIAGTPQQGTATDNNPFAGRVY